MSGTRIIIREATEGDINFVLATWLRGNYYGTYLKTMPQDLYFREYAQVILEVLRLPDIEVMIACDESNPIWNVGFSVSSGPVLHWIYVKGDYRKQGVATLLLRDKNILEVKALTRVGWAIAQKKNLIFNPL